MKQLQIFPKLESLNLSNTNIDLILNLDFPIENNINQLDLSSNDLVDLRQDFFLATESLRSLNLNDNRLRDFEFLTNLKNLNRLDLSNNRGFGADANKYLAKFKFLYELKIKNISSNSLSIFYQSNPLILSRYNFEYLDVSHNNLTYFAYTKSDVIYLDLSFNVFNYMMSVDVLEQGFMELFIEMKTINLTNCLASLISNKKFYFNKQLEAGIFSSNGLTSFPKFCQFCTSFHCDKISNINVNCQLRIVEFDSNHLTKIDYIDLNELENLEYLNLENNLLAAIENNSFSNLVKLETLILSRNRLSSFSRDVVVFSCLTNLKLLNLSSNTLEEIPPYLFSDLFKLETLDLSFNRIIIFYSYSFWRLTSLRNFHANENDDSLKFESNKTFIQCDSLQNVYVSQKILVDQNNANVLLNIFAEKKKGINKTVLKRSYFKSLFLLSNYSKYDCNLTLFFIRNNVHYNFKTETQIFDYFSECSLLKIKTVSVLFWIRVVDLYIFSDIGVYFFYFTLLFVLGVGFYLCFFGKKG